MMAWGPPGDWTVRKTEVFLARRVRAICLACLRPFGYLAFVLALAALSASARLLGEEHELGFFAGRLNEMIRRYPEITRRGVQMAWVAWAALFALALSPISPTRWDETLLGAVALGVCLGPLPCASSGAGSALAESGVEVLKRPRKANLFRVQFAHGCGQAILGEILRLDPTCLCDELQCAH